jgi:hypothetical protein
MTTRNYSQGIYNANVYGEWAKTDASVTITATSSFGFLAVRQYGLNEYGINVFGVWHQTDSGQITVSASSNLGLTAAVPVDTYSSGEYSYGNYSAGTYRDAMATVSAVASASAIGVYTANVAVIISAVSSSSLTGQIVTGAIIPVVGTSSLTATGNVTFSGNPYPINAVSSVTVSPVRILLIGVNPIVGASSTDFFARYKWEDVPITSTNWTNVYKVAA